MPHASQANSSFDADEDLDSDLAEELSRFRTPDTWSKVANHLDLVWKIGRATVRGGVVGVCAEHHMHMMAVQRPHTVLAMPMLDVFRVAISHRCAKWQSIQSSVYCTCN